MRSMLILPAVLAVTAASAVPAQGVDTLVPGQRVRVEFACPPGPRTFPPCTKPVPKRVQTGQLVRADRDTLRLEPHLATPVLRLPLDAIREVRVSRGRHRHELIGALAGTALGAGIGALIGSSIQWGPFLDSGPATGLGVIIGAPAGFLLGITIGHFIQTERWQLARLPGQ